MKEKYVLSLFLCVSLVFSVASIFFQATLENPVGDGFLGVLKEEGWRGGEGGARGISGEGSCGHFLAPLSVSHVCWKFAPTRPCHL